MIRIGRRTQLYKGDNLHICTFSHLHINPAFAHSHICTLTKH